MVEWITYWGQKLGQDLLTVQIAIVYIDKIISQFNDAIDNKYLWGVTWLLLASKYMEVDHKLIKIKNLRNVSVRASFSKEKTIKWEQKLMGMLKYEFITKPPIYYFYALGHEVLDLDQEFFETLKVYWEATLKTTDIQSHSYDVQFCAALIKTSQITNNYFWDVRMLVRSFGWSYNDIQKWLSELNEIDIDDFRKYSPNDWSIHRKNGTSNYRAHSLKKLADEKRHSRSNSYSNYNQKVNITNIKKMLANFDSENNELHSANTINPIQKLSDFYGGNTSSFKSLKLTIKDTEYHTWEAEWIDSIKASYKPNAYKISKRFSK